MSELPCVSCGVEITAEASNCPDCGQRQMTRATAIAYTTVGVPAVLLALGGSVVVGVPSVLDQTIGLAGLVLTLLAAYCLVSLGFLHAYAKRRRLLQQPTAATHEDPGQSATETQ
ncbi:hypothetical protein [Halomarina rubra]|uniref:Zinc ribbon domain-containing protein n=1 Tax=Halomarina rubra TaxID=2071873 RepID=A0ABD6AY71_9EURY|nr:hypothetical protein [Halomarina rubra]